MRLSSRSALARTLLFARVLPRDRRIEAAADDRSFLHHHRAHGYLSSLRKRVCAGRAHRDVHRRREDDARQIYSIWRRRRRRPGAPIVAKHHRAALPYGDEPGTEYDAIQILRQRRCDRDRVPGGAVRARYDRARVANDDVRPSVLVNIEPSIPSATNCWPEKITALRFVVAENPTGSKVAGIHAVTPRGSVLV